MSLIKCPECGKEVSDTCDYCIHCGYKLREKASIKPEENVNECKEFSAIRANAGGVKGLFILNIILGGFLLTFGIVFLIIYISLLRKNPGEDVPSLILAIFFMSLSVLPIYVGVDGFVKDYNNSQVKEPLIKYIPGEDIFHLVDYNGKKLDVKIKDYYDIKCNYFGTSNAFYFYYLKHGRKVKINLGYCGNREEAKSTLFKIKDQHIKSKNDF